MRKAGWVADDLGADNHANAVRWRLARPKENACNQPSQDSRHSQSASLASQASDEYAPSPSDTALIAVLTEGLGGAVEIQPTATQEVHPR